MILDLYLNIMIIFHNLYEVKNTQSGINPFYKTICPTGNFDSRILSGNS
jgi:hypothetical protein